MTPTDIAKVKKSRIADVIVPRYLAITIDENFLRSVTLKY